MGHLGAAGVTSRPATRDRRAIAGHAGPSGAFRFPVETARRRLNQLRQHRATSLEQAKPLISDRPMLATAVREGVIQ